MLLLMRCTEPSPNRKLTPTVCPLDMASASVTMWSLGRCGPQWPRTTPKALKNCRARALRHLSVGNHAHPTRQRHRRAAFADEKSRAKTIGNVSDAVAMGAAHKGAGMGRCREIVNAIVAVAGDITAMSQYPGVGTAIGQRERIQRTVARTGKDSQGCGSAPPPSLPGCHRPAG